MFFVDPYKWPCKWANGVITPLNGVRTLLKTGRGPSCRREPWYVWIVNWSILQNLGDAYCPSWHLTYRCLKLATSGMPKDSQVFFPTRHVWTMCLWHPRYPPEISHSKNRHVWIEIHFTNHHFWYLCSILGGVHATPSRHGVMWIVRIQGISSRASNETLHQRRLMRRNDKAASFNGDEMKPKWVDALKLRKGLIKQIDKMFFSIK